MPHLPSQEDIQKGQSIYSKNNLPFYDLFVIQFSNHFAWHCPRKKLIAFFKDNVSHNHLDIGVGTGYFLNKLDASPDEQRIGLLDLNEHCLAYAKKKLARFNPEVYRQDVFAPFSDITQKFDSVSLNYLIHCLPGSLRKRQLYLIMSNRY